MKGKLSGPRKQGNDPLPGLGTKINKLRLAGDGWTGAWA